MTDRIYLSPPDMTDAERARLLGAFESNWIAPLGPEVDAFEAELAVRCGVSAAAALNSGTAALHLALILSDVGPGDTVWTSTLTFAATANVVRYVGATPVFVDSDESTWNMDPALLAQALRDASAASRLPKAIIVVDLYGQCADYDQIRPVCDEYGITLIEDAAEALGASYKGRPAGALAKLATLSFNGNKVITTSGGGALLSHDPGLAEHARYLAAQARQPVPHYEHTDVGYNYRLSNLLAAVGRAQLGRLDTMVKRRRELFATYSRSVGALPGVEMMPQAHYGEPNRWLTCLQIDEGVCGVGPDTLRGHLEAANIEARPLWKPMHLQPVFRGCEVVGGAVAESLYARGLCLPSGSSMTDPDQARVIETFMTCPGLVQEAIA